MYARKLGRGDETIVVWCWKTLHSLRLEICQLGCVTYDSSNSRTSIIHRLNGNPCMKIPLGGETFLPLDTRCDLKHPSTNSALHLRKRRAELVLNFSCVYLANQSSRSHLSFIYVIFGT